MGYIVLEPRTVSRSLFLDRPNYRYHHALPRCDGELCARPLRATNGRECSASKHGWLYNCLLYAEIECTSLIVRLSRDKVLPPRVLKSNSTASWSHCIVVWIALIGDCGAVDFGQIFVGESAIAGNVDRNGPRPVGGSPFHWDCTVSIPAAQAGWLAEYVCVCCGYAAVKSEFKQDTELRTGG